MLKRALFTVVATLLAAPVSAETHPKVQAALDWELPAHECERPDMLFTQGIVDSDGVPSTNRRLEPGKERLYKKKKKKFDKCIMTYKQGLIAEFTELRDVAQYGLTQPQADAILGKLALIQTIIEDPLAELPKE